MKYYKLTLRKVQNPSWIYYYDEFLARFKKKYPTALVEYHYEFVQPSNLHIHAYIESPTSIYIDKIHPGKGWNIEFKPCLDKAGWLEYIRKNVNEEADLINSQYRLLEEYNEYFESSSVESVSEGPLAIPQEHIEK